MDVFIKKLGSQESGYSGNKPNQRGKYILIPSSCWDFFPSLSESILNDVTVIGCVLPNKKEIALSLVYQNSKFFPQTHSSSHNERRLYWNTVSEKELKIDKEVIVVFIKLPDNRYSVFYIKPEENDYREWEKNSGKKLNLNHFSDSKRLSAALDDINNAPISNFLEVSKDIGKRSKKLELNKTIKEFDPAKALATLIKNEKDLTNYMIEMWENKCALRKQSIIEKSSIGLRVAQIRPFNKEGPMVPTNGVLLSSDLSDAFENGAFTLSDDLRVLVNPKVPTSSELRKYSDMQIMCREEFEVFLPHKIYLSFHRKNVFERFEL